MGGGSPAGRRRRRRRRRTRRRPSPPRARRGSRLELLATLAHVFPGVIVVLREEVLRERRDGLELGRARRPILLLPRARALLLLLALLAALLLLALLLRLLGRRRVPPTAAAAPARFGALAPIAVDVAVAVDATEPSLQRGDLRVQIIQTARGRHPSRRPRAALSSSLVVRPRMRLTKRRVSREARSERRSTEMNIVARDIARSPEKSSCAQRSISDRRIRACSLVTRSLGLPRASHPRSSLVPDEPRERGVPRRQRDALDDVSFSVRFRRGWRARGNTKSTSPSAIRTKYACCRPRAKPPPVPFRWRR